MPLLSTKGAASVQGFGAFLNSSPTYYYWAWFSYANVNNGGGGTVYDPTSKNVYYGLNLEVSPAVNYSFGRMDVDTFTAQYAVSFNYASGSVNTASYFVKPVWQASSNSVLSFAYPPGGLVIVQSHSNANPPVMNWINQYVITLYSTHLGQGYGEPIALAKIGVDSSGNIYGAGTGSDATHAGAVLWKTNSSGTASSWVTGVTSTLSTPIEFKGMAVSPSGNIYAAGDYTPLGAAWIVKANSSGVVQWQKSMIGLGVPGGNDVGMILDSSENVYTLFTVTFAEVYLVKLNSSGAFQWGRNFSIGGSINPISQDKSIAIDSSDNVYIGLAGPSGSVYIVKYNSSGVIQWQRKLEVSGSSVASSYFIPTSLVVAGNSIVLNTLGLSSSAYGFPTLFKFPLDGTKLGAYSINGATYTYSASSGTDVSQPLTVANTAETFISGTNTITTGNPYTRYTASAVETKGAL